MNIQIVKRDFETEVVRNVTSVHSKESYKYYNDTLVVTDQNGDEREYTNVVKVEVFL